LEDIMALCFETRQQLDEAIERAEKHRDVVLLARVARISQNLAEIEGLARDARQGDYRGN